MSPKLFNNVLIKGMGLCPRLEYEGLVATLTQKQWWSDEASTASTGHFLSEPRLSWKKPSGPAGPLLCSHTQGTGRCGQVVSRPGPLAISPVAQSVSE